jgi:hypothetical protein
MEHDSVSRKPLRCIRLRTLPLGLRLHVRVRFEQLRPSVFRFEFADIQADLLFSGTNAFVCSVLQHNTSCWQDRDRGDEKSDRTPTQSQFPKSAACLTLVFEPA